jgi:hypothetical protein
MMVLMCLIVRESSIELSMIGEQLVLQCSAPRMDTGLNVDVEDNHMTCYNMMTVAGDPYVGSLCNDEAG